MKRNQALRKCRLSVITLHRGYHVRECILGENPFLQASITISQELLSRTAMEPIGQPFEVPNRI